MIEHSCSYALSRKTSADEILINIDALTPALFHEVNLFIQSRLLAGGKAKGKKRPVSEVI